MALKWIVENKIQRKSTTKIEHNLFGKSYRIEMSSQISVIESQFSNAFNWTMSSFIFCRLPMQSNVSSCYFGHFVLFEWIFWTKLRTVNLILKLVYLFMQFQFVQNDFSVHSFISLFLVIHCHHFPRVVLSFINFHLFFDHFTIHSLPTIFVFSFSRIAHISRRLFSHFILLVSFFLDHFHFLVLLERVSTTSAAIWTELFGQFSCMSRDKRNNHTGTRASMSLSFVLFFFSSLRRFSSHVKFTNR